MNNVQPHIFADKATLDSFDISQFVDKALVIDCRMLANGEEITLDRIKKYSKKQTKPKFCFLI